MWGVAAVVMLVLWAIQERTKDAGIVDVAWAVGLGIGAAWLAWTAPGDPNRRVLLCGMVGLWAFRLAGYLLYRVLNFPEDGRYAHLRSHWGAKSTQGYFWFFQIQASWVVMFSLPFVAVAWNPMPLGDPWAIIGVIVWGLAFGGEVIADGQLNRWRRNPANQGKTCRTGLWGRSRHPNYFFEWLHWFAYVFLAIGSDWIWLALAGPIVMYAFLWRLTGIPWVEAQALRTRGYDYARYMADTPAFFPRLDYR
jgi:steroid 5-alpha reductase family enzyme